MHEAIVHTNAHLIERFYTAFQSRDGDAMAACYAPDVKFSDEVFPDLRGPRAGAMWRMLCGRAKDLSVEFRDVQANDTVGSAHWDARYTFGATGRKVVNRIDATFRFRDGLISEHRDAFDFYAWARQALGPAGLLLGWTPMIKAKVRKTAAQGLDAFMSK
jgi:ketosteroid isomerase-like protein